MISEWLFWTVGGLVFLVWQYGIPAIQRWRRVRAQGKELGDPIAVEVIYRDEPVADLSDREFTELFWRDYRIVPRSEKGRRIIENDDLWDECAFTFRDTKTGDVCTTGFVGGKRPFITNDRISLRALYFGGRPRKTELKSGKKKIKPPLETISRSKHTCD